jgi:DNA-directed RNA polymerase specialized sigma24 family protein
VLCSRDRAKDVAQEMFLAFGRSSVPAGETAGWLSVAAAHTALNLLRSGRRRAAREENVAAAYPAVVPYVADAALDRDPRQGPSGGVGHPGRASGGVRPGCGWLPWTVGRRAGCGRPAC